MQFIAVFILIHLFAVRTLFVCLFVCSVYVLKPTTNNTNSVTIILCLKMNFVFLCFHSSVYFVLNSITSLTGLKGSQKVYNNLYFTYDYINLRVTVQNFFSLSFFVLC